MIFFKTKAQKITEALNKFPPKIDSTKKMLSESSLSGERLEEVLVQINAFEQNFTRLIERYKFEENTLLQILLDTNQYNDIIIYTIIDLESVSENGEYTEQQEKIAEGNMIKMEEINLRFKKLLGEHYTDPFELLND